MLSTHQILTVSSSDSDLFKKYSGSSMPGVMLLLLYFPQPVPSESLSTAVEVPGMSAKCRPGMERRN